MDGNLPVLICHGNSRATELLLSVRLPFRLNPHVVARKVDERVVLVHLQSNRIYELNSTGAYVWELLLDHADRERLYAQTISTFDAPAHVVRAEIDALLSRLLAEGLIDE